MMTKCFDLDQSARLSANGSNSNVRAGDWKVGFVLVTVAKVESCSGLIFWRELEARRDR